MELKAQPSTSAELKQKNLSDSECKALSHSVTLPKLVRFPEVVLPFTFLPKKCEGKPHVKDVIHKIPLNCKFYWNCYIWLNNKCWFTSMELSTK